MAAYREVAFPPVDLEVEHRPDGTLVLTYVQRLDLDEGRLVTYRRGCGVLLSRDHGLTWDLDHELLDPDPVHTSSPLHLSGRRSARVSAREGWR